MMRLHDELFYITADLEVLASEPSAFVWPDPRARPRSSCAR